MALPAYTTTSEKISYYGLRVFVGVVLLFLIAPILAIMPLSFNSETFFSYPMPGFSTKWYVGEAGFFTNPRWTDALKLSVIVAVATTVLATFLGTFAALGLSRSRIPGRAAIMAVLISPMIVPVIISAIGLFFFYAYVGLNGTLIGIILAHTALATPFVVITVTATLMSFDRTLMRAGASCGARPHTVFFKVVMPLILPGVISGALFAFVTSFDEVIVTTFTAGQQATLPIWMLTELIRPRQRPLTNVVAILVIAVTFLQSAKPETGSFRMPSAFPQTILFR